MNTYTNIVTRISPIPDSSAVQLLVEDIDTHNPICARMFNNNDDCQDFIKKYDTSDASISQNIIEALKLEDKKTRLCHKYDNDALIDALLEEYTCEEAAQMMEDGYHCFDSERDFAIDVVENGYFGYFHDFGTLSSDLHIYIDYDKLACHLLIHNYHCYEVAGKCYFFKTS